MMKKTFAALIVAGLAGTSGFTYAADNTVTALTSGAYVETLAATGCSLLRDRVSVNTSVGVIAVYNCRTAAVKVNVGACHTSGSQKPTDIPCVVTGDDGGNPAVPTFNGANCTVAGQSTVPVQTTNIEGRRAYVGSTTGGSVGQTSLGATTCTVGTLGAVSGVAN